MISDDKLINNIKDLQNQTVFQDLMDRIMLLHKIENGLEQSNAHQTKTIDQVKIKLKKWFK